MNSFEGINRTVRNIVLAKDEVAKVQLVRVLEVGGDFCCTGDIWHLTEDLMAVWDKHEEMQLTESLSKQMMH